MTSTMTSTITQTLTGMSVLQATLFWLFLGMTAVATKRIYARLVHHKQAPSAPAKHHNIALCSQSVL
jgi:hypothetical protein